MNITYTWFITALECLPSFNSQTNVVSAIHWNLNAKSDETNTYTTLDGKQETFFYEGNVNGVQSVTFDSNQQFIDFSELTESQIQNWLTNAIGATEIQALETQLQQIIQNQITPSVVMPSLPWIKT